MQPDSDQWARFAAAALTATLAETGNIEEATHDAAITADFMIREWKDRFPRHPQNPGNDGRRAWGWSVPSHKGTNIP